MALHESEFLPHISDYLREMIEEFVSSDMKIAEIDVPEHYKEANSVNAFRDYAYQIIRRSDYSDEMKACRGGDKVYFIRK